MTKPTRLIDRLLTHRIRRVELDKRIKDELARPAPNGLRLQTLKRLKLHSKDQICMIKMQMDTNDGPNFPSAA